MARHPPLLPQRMMSLAKVSGRTRGKLSRILRDYFQRRSIAETNLRTKKVEAKCRSGDDRKPAAALTAHNDDVEDDKAVKACVEVATASQRGRRSTQHGNDEPGGRSNMSGGDAHQQSPRRKYQAVDIKPALWLQECTKQGKDPFIGHQAVPQISIY